MKAQELIEILKDYQDFEVEPRMVRKCNCIGGYLRDMPMKEINKCPHRDFYTSFKINWVTDIGHSEKKIILDIEEET